MKKYPDRQLSRPSNTNPTNKKSSDSNKSSDSKRPMAKPIGYFVPEKSSKSSSARSNHPSFG